MSRTFRATMLAGVSLCTLLSAAGPAAMRNNPRMSVSTVRKRWRMPGR